ncbi:hypothetical protein NIES2119_09995 [[Phormidium ambiguum] IAM M-71]|uniref:Uncharacterized protein n=1 Tax=[Phormidium ambiguum] IAM M-71 TaxID=454136 RepID=A0A1U7IM38_9CYAN|nr:hypothetical protein [Phormidium ambiguum]OKH38359.1 hypothetical protein NIES2119_09995 [Phormidium ambiguum IAM M-71]
MSICNLASQAVGGLTQGTGGSIVGGVANVLSVLGAADIGIQLGTGGQAGLFDLPNLLNTPGIDCNGTLVTPLQWYANGMSCDGLRNSDQDRIEREIREFEERLRLREELRNSPFNIPSNHFNSDVPNDHIREVLDQLDGERTPPQGTVFDFNGTLEQNTWGLLQAGVSNTFTASNFNFKYKYTKEEHPWNFPTFAVSAGQTLQRKDISPPSGGGWTYVLASMFLGSQILNGAGLDLRTNVLKNFVPWLNQTFIQVSTQVYVSDASFRFVANGSPPGVYIFEEYGGGRNPPRRDPISPCNDGNRRRQPMPCSQCKLTPDLINKINQLHKACAADRLANGMPYFPEKDIRNYGRQLYQANPNNVNGQVKPGNLIDVIAATIAAEYHRLGLQRLPAELPESLIPKTNAAAELFDRDTVKVDNCLSFHEQVFKLHDEVLGQWPIHFKVTDDGKTNDVKLWNLSEAIAEIYGMQTKVVEDADLAVHWGIRSATEASKAGNAALKTLHLLQELVKFTGAITVPGSLTVTSTFTPDPVAKQTTEQMLQPSTQTLIVTDIVDGSSLLELLKTISYAAQISAKAVLQPLKPNPATGQAAMPGDFIKTERKKRRIDDKTFEKWKKEKEQPLANIPEQQRPPGYKVPDIKIVAQPDEKK